MFPGGVGAAGSGAYSKRKSKLQNLNPTSNSPNLNANTTTTDVDGRCWEEKYRPVDITQVPMHITKVGVGVLYCV